MRSDRGVFLDKQLQATILLRPHEMGMLADHLEEIAKSLRRGYRYEFLALIRSYILKMEETAVSNTPQT